jgi:uncharacterized protein
MIIPGTRIAEVNLAIGLGVFARNPIPRGTIVVVPDVLDTVIDPQQFEALPEILRAAAETYMFHDSRGSLVLSWDHGRYMNHSCRANTMLTAYGVEVAVRDIAAGEEITTEYGLLNVQDPFPVACGCPDCRRHVTPDDIDHHGDDWDRLILNALQLAGTIPQPLWPLIDADIQQNIIELATTPCRYRSVREITWRSGAN